MAGWHRALILDSEDRQAQLVPDGSDELCPPELESTCLAWHGVEPVLGGQSSWEGGELFTQTFTHAFYPSSSG